jgi:glycosyltransferase involved in cell wall biosynthesis
MALITDTRRRERIMVAGLRGVVGVQGGIETHARKLYPLLVRLGCDVEIVQRSPYFPVSGRRRHWHGMRLTYIWCPTTPGLETAVHSLLAVLYAAVRRPDVLHLHAIGPGLLAPLARLFGLRVVLTHHAVDHEREKWGQLATRILRLGERLGVRYANRPIAVSPVIKRRLIDHFGIGADFIPNGAPLALAAESCEALDRFGLRPHRYVLCVARLEPTKRQSDLIDAFQQARLGGWKLALVGGFEPTRYCIELKKRARADPDIVLTGFQTGTALRELFTHAGLFVLPSALEGHPIALLEALSFGLPVLASANRANLAVPLPRDRFFETGDVETLAGMLLASRSDATSDDTNRRELRARIRRDYSWQKAARMTKGVYGQVIAMTYRGSGSGAGQGVG